MSRQETELLSEKGERSPPQLVASVLCWQISPPGSHRSNNKLWVTAQTWRAQKSTFCQVEKYLSHFIFTLGKHPALRSAYQHEAGESSPLLDDGICFCKVRLRLSSSCGWLIAKIVKAAIVIRGLQFAGTGSIFYWSRECSWRQLPNPLLAWNSSLLWKLWWRICVPKSLWWVQCVLSFTCLKRVCI